MEAEPPPVMGTTSDPRSVGTVDGPRGGLPVVRDSWRRIFRLPMSSSWLRLWLLTAASDAEAVPIASLRAAAVECSEVYRQPPGIAPGVPFGLDEMDPKLALTWLLLPTSSINGLTLGLIWTDVSINTLQGDPMVIGPAPSGRFAMDEAMGELFATSWRPSDNTIIVAWTASVLSCERVRETIHFDAPAPATLPAHIITRMSFHERRYCHLCGPTTGRGAPPPDLSDLPSPCRGIPARRVTSPSNFAGFGFHGFRGTYFGTVLLSRYRPAGGSVHGGGKCLAQERRLISIRLRRAKPDRRRMLRLALAASANSITWGLSPWVGVMYVPALWAALPPSEAVGERLRAAEAAAARRSRSTVVLRVPAAGTPVDAAAVVDAATVALGHGGEGGQVQGQGRGGVGLSALGDTCAVSARREGAFADDTAVPHDVSSECGRCAYGRSRGGWGGDSVSAAASTSGPGGGSGEGVPTIDISRVPTGVGRGGSSAGGGPTPHSLSSLDGWSAPPAAAAAAAAAFFSVPPGEVVASRGRGRGGPAQSLPSYNVAVDSSSGCLLSAVPHSLSPSCPLPAGRGSGGGGGSDGGGGGGGGDGANLGHRRLVVAAMGGEQSEEDDDLVRIDSLISERPPLLPRGYPPGSAGRQSRNIVLPPTGGGGGGPARRSDTLLSSGSPREKEEEGGKASGDGGRVDGVSAGAASSAAASLTCGHGSAAGWSGAGRTVVGSSAADSSALLRMRNLDSDERRSVRYARAVRNRVSAKRSNERRKTTLIANNEELASLQARLPVLRLRLAELVAEQAALQKRLGGEEAAMAALASAAAVQPPRPSRLPPPETDVERELAAGLGQVGGDGAPANQRGLSGSEEADRSDREPPPDAGGEDREG